MDRLFLDANVLVAAAWKESARVRRLWELRNVELVASTYAAAEAARNLPDEDRRALYEKLIESVRVVSEMGDLAKSAVRLPGDLSLPDDDLPILLSAIEAGATHLITGDFRHFGKHFDREIAGVRILPPAEYLRSRGKQGASPPTAP